LTLTGVASSNDIHAIQQASRDFDSGHSSFGNTQSPQRSYMHGMRAPGQVGAAATQETNNFVHAMIARAQKEERSHHHEAALRDFGIAIHPLVDQTSPAHADGSGNPAPWPGVSLGHAGTDLAHVSHEYVLPTTDQLNRAAAEIQARYAEVFGH